MTNIFCRDRFCHNSFVATKLPAVQTLMYTEKHCSASIFSGGQKGCVSFFLRKSGVSTLCLFASGILNIIPDYNRRCAGVKAFNSAFFVIILLFPLFIPLSSLSSSMISFSFLLHRWVGIITTMCCSYFQLFSPITQSTMQPHIQMCICSCK